MIHGVTFRLCIIYRPPPSKGNGLVNTVFFDQWSAYLDIVMLDSYTIIRTGDLNFHLDNPAELDVRRFSETLADRGMTQLVESPTHRGGHILDVVIVRETGSIISALPTVYDPCLCDKQGNIYGGHLAVRFAVHASKPDRLRKVVTFRRLRQICVSDFAQDIASHQWTWAPMVLSPNWFFTTILTCEIPLTTTPHCRSLLWRCDLTRLGLPIHSDRRNVIDVNLRELGCELGWKCIGKHTGQHVWPSTACCSLRKANIIRKRSLLAEEIRNNSSYNKEHHGWHWDHENAIVCVSWSLGTEVFWSLHW